MNSSNIQHLYWRAGFGLSPKQWQARKNWTIPRTVDFLFQKATLAQQQLQKASFDTSLERRKKELSKKELAALRKEQRRLVHLQNIDWVLAMGKGNGSDLLNKMTLFWHGHFACTSKTGRVAFNQLLALKTHALGNFRDLVLAIAKDPAMIRFLNNQQNRKNSPNENFARELMELFTIGRGNYTEQDVKEAARAFTGWSSNMKGEFVFRNRQHDYGQKRFMGQTGSFDGTDVIDIILSKKATAEFICRKIYCFFVNPTVNENRVQALAHLFYQSDYDIGGLMRHIFTSDWFYNPKHKGVKIKSPTEFLAGMVRQLDLSINNKVALFGIQKALGQTLFNPPNVAGWKGDKHWIDNATLLLRLNLPQAIFLAAEINLKEKDDLEGKNRGNKLKKLNANANLQPLLSLLDKESKELVFAQLSQYLLVKKTTQHAVDLEKFTNKKSPDNFIKSLTMRLMMLPEYQLC